MSKPKRAALSLADLKTKKPGADQATEAAEPKGGLTKVTDAGKRKGLTLRLSPAAWRQLKILALQKDAHAHELIIEALNTYFAAHELPPIA